LYLRHQSQPSKRLEKLYRSHLQKLRAASTPSVAWSRPHISKETLREANMQHHRNASSRRTPPPDIVRSSRTTTAGPLALPTRPAYEFLIIGLFALRLTKRMIEGLEYYPRRDNDIVWLTKFLAPYSHELALAKIYGLRKEDYIATYQDIISRMKRQPRYPLRFMQMNPDHCTRQQQNSRMSERKTSTEMTDGELPSQLVAH
jgi:hypothetical protein